MANRKATGKSEARAGGERLSSVATAIRLLKAFSEDDDELGISELSRRLGLAKSTVHRLAVTWSRRACSSRTATTASITSASRCSGSARWCAGA